jgi:hypothetical protein
MNPVYKLFMDCYVSLSTDSSVLVGIEGEDEGYETYCDNPWAIIQTIRLCEGKHSPYIVTPYKEEVEAYIHTNYPGLNIDEECQFEYNEDMPLDEQAWQAWGIMNTLFGVYPVPVGQFD